MTGFVLFFSIQDMYIMNDGLVLVLVVFLVFLVCARARKELLTTNSTRSYVALVLLRRNSINNWSNSFRIRI
jgi:hypothetical protein